MPSKYWIKLYHEILDDPKMGRLPDRLWRRAIELFLMAGEQDEDGTLPSVADMAWRLRTTENELEEDLIALSADGISIVEPQEGRWFVVQFANRQAKIEPKERMRRYRERKRKEHYYGDEPDTSELRDSDKGVTTRNTDTDIDSPPTGGKAPPAKPQTPAQAMFTALADLCQIDWRVCDEKQRGALNQTEKRLRVKARASPDDLIEFGKWWFAYDWRGKKGEAPAPAQVRETWGKFAEWRNGSKSKELDGQPIEPVFLED